MNLLKFLNMYQDFISGYTYADDRAKIILEYEGSQVKFPIVTDLPEIIVPQNNGVFKSVAGDMSTIGLMGLREISLEAMLCPKDVSKLTYANGDNGLDIINFINNNRPLGKPFRIVITKGAQTYVNMLCLINSFSYTQDRIGDFVVNLDLVEYVERGVQSVTNQGNS